MKRTINTPHDVVQILIDIIVANENKIDIYTQYFSRQNQVRVTINTQYYIYICNYELQGDRVEIRRYKKIYSSSTKVLVACTFRVHGYHTDYINVQSFPQKIQIINL